MQKSILSGRTTLGLGITLAVMLAGCKNSATMKGGAPALSSGDQQLEQKMAPVIECLNRTLSHFQEMTPSYDQKIREISGAKPPVSATGMPVIPSFDATYVTFKVEPYERGGEFSRACADGLDKAAGMSPSNPTIDAPAKDAAAALRSLLVPGDQMDAYLEQKAYQDDGGARGRQLNATISPLLTKLVADTRQLRSAVFDAKATLVQHELDAIEKKNGRDLNWHTQQTMQAASVANHQVQVAASNNHLNAALITQAMAPFQAAMDDTQSYLSAHPEAARDMPGKPFAAWPTIDTSLGAELAQMRELRTSFSGGHPDVSTVNMQLDAVNSSFNGAVRNYNSTSGIAVAPR